MIRLKASLVCCLQSQERPCLPGGPSWPQSGTHARTHQMRRYFTALGPRLITGGHQVNSENTTAKFKKLLLGFMLHLQSDACSALSVSLTQTHTAQPKSTSICQIGKRKAATRHKHNYLHMLSDTQPHSV